MRPEMDKIKFADIEAVKMDNESLKHYISNKNLENFVLVPANLFKQYPELINFSKIMQVNNEPAVVVILSTQSSLVTSMFCELVYSEADIMKELFELCDMIQNPTIISKISKLYQVAVSFDASIPIKQVNQVDCPIPLTYYQLCVYLLKPEYAISIFKNDYIYKFMNTKDERAVYRLLLCVNAWISILKVQLSTNTLFMTVEEAEVHPLLKYYRSDYGHIHTGHISSNPKKAYQILIDAGVVFCSSELRAYSMSGYITNTSLADIAYKLASNGITFDFTQKSLIVESTIVEKDPITTSALYLKQGKIHVNVFKILEDVVYTRAKYLGKTVHRSFTIEQFTKGAN